MTKPARTALLTAALILLTGQYAAAEVIKKELKSINTPDSVKTPIGEMKRKK
jgi:hypothetical protein